MSFQTIYKEKLVKPEQAVLEVKSHDFVQYNSYNGIPPTLDKALSMRRDELTGVVINTSVTLYPLHTVTSDPSGEHFIYDNWHASVHDRKIADQTGNYYYVPALYYEMPITFKRKNIMDIVMVQVSPMDENGNFNFGPNTAHARDIIKSAGKVIVEVNHKFPIVLGEDVSVHISEIDLVVEGENQDLFTIPTVKPKPTDELIAKLIMEEIEDGSCLQLGIGGLPNAVGELIADSDLKDLGVHSEMLTDGFVKMYETGRITGSNKALNRGEMVFSFAMGSQFLYDFIHQNPVCVSYPISHVNTPHMIAKNPKVVAINNSIEVDLFSQINSESSGSRQISGTGGQVDFMLGSYMSEGGKGIICMSSTYTDKEGNLISRIRPTLPEGTIVTVPRTISHYIVTEYGIIDLKGKSTWQRAELLISIAHPNFRDELVKEAQKLGIWRRTNK
ncbi:MAG TPA: acetyl-CoA hydrolase/transferase C-terminal domain-containing protein [Syntrophomonadaceae bacterium]|nr:acetyl-CoA hydrolase/transferase C-terminal domain-containing protein [Syntrophomonadaceae bacterium]